MLARLRRWRDQGWLRPLDHALPAWLQQQAPEAPASLLLATALLAALEGRGHSGLPLAVLEDEAAWAAAWGCAPEAQAEFAAALRDAPPEPARWAASGCVQADPADEHGATPLVLQLGLLALRRHWRSEREVARAVLQRAAAIDAPPFDGAVARGLLDALFPPRAEGGRDWQRVAATLALRGRLTLVTGGPGTGKTHTAARMLVLLQALLGSAQPLRVALAAPTGKAAARLRQSIQQALQALREPLGEAWPLGDWAAALGPARTLHALLGARPGTRRRVHDASNPLPLDLLFVDEASMVHLELMAELLAALPPGARVVLLGDKDQLASVEAGAVMGELCAGAAGLDAGAAAWVTALGGPDLSSEVSGSADALSAQTVVLRESRRFAGDIGRLAAALNHGDAAAALALLRDAGSAQLTWLARDAGAVPGLASAEAGYRPCFERLAQRPAAPEAFEPWARELLRAFDRFRVLCALREGPYGVTGLNPAIEQALQRAGLLRRGGEWYEGRPVMVTRNEAQLGVFNGDIGLVLRPPHEGGLRVYFLEGDVLRSVAASRLAQVETAFALTVHKSQGSEFAHVLLVLPEVDSPLLTRELLYTGVTRSRERFTLLAPQAAPLVAACGRATRRFGGLRAQLGRQPAADHSDS
jgi:exodeoxyribonuclease V alpha subunit